MSVIVALDAGLANLGIAIFEYMDGEWALSKMQVKRTEGTPKKQMAKMKDVSASSDMARRIKELCEEFEYVFADYPPDLLIAELPTGGGKDANAIKGMAVGLTIIVTVSEMLHVPLVHVSPRDVKMEATNNPEASKTDIKDIIGNLYPDASEEFKSKLSTDGWKGTFEHAADAAMAFRAARNRDEVKHLEYE